jgi:prevent-host-death family protein
MHTIDLDKDIKPLSEFRAHTASCIKQVQHSKRPIVITQHGKSAAVLIDVVEFESMTQQLELMRDITSSESMINNGNGILHDKALDIVLERISK